MNHPYGLDGGRGDGAATSHTYYNLTPAIEYDFSVSTRAIDGRLSRAVSVVVETDCDIFSEWCERFACSVETPLASFGDGVCIVGRRIEAGTYLTGTPGDAPSCEWGRLSDFVGTEAAPAETGGFSERRVVEIAETDHAFDTFGCGTWTRQEQNE